jgi:hypothetical protein
MSKNFNDAGWRQTNITEWLPNAHYLPGFHVDAWNRTRKWYRKSEEINTWVFDHEKAQGEVLSY